MAPNSRFPEPLVVRPLLQHETTFVLLHGQGSNALRFGPTLLETPAVESPRLPEPPESQAIRTLRTTFPHAKFVFPTAPQSRATIYKRRTINQWFDCWHLTKPMEREEIQVAGLQETVAFVHDLIRREASLVGGPANVVLGGLSLGCAAGLIAMLLWEDEPLSAFVGMCGLLPYRARMEEAMTGATEEHDAPDFDLFGGSSNSEVRDTALNDPHSAAVTWLREELEFASRYRPAVVLRTPKTPVFLAHGYEDPKVPIQLGREASSFLGASGVEVTWKEYEGLGHWYSADMLFDLAQFALHKRG